MHLKYHHRNLTLYDFKDIGKLQIFSPPPLLPKAGFPLVFIYAVTQTVQPSYEKA